MTKTIEAVYENGVFRPVEPVALPEGERVTITVPADETSDLMTPSEHDTLIRRILEIAAIPSRDNDGSGGDRHDEIIYGTQDDLK